MGLEIERKFLVNGQGWRDHGVGLRCRQGYLTIAKEVTVRVRIVDERGYLTIKGKSVGIVRPEYEYEIPLPDAEEMLADLCEKPLIAKNRYQVLYRDMLWEVDEFFGENEGLIIAEVELDRPGQHLEYPPWLGQEVTGEYRYCNVALVRNPYRNWR